MRAKLTLALVFVFCIVLAVPSHAGTKRILLVGDSYLERMAEYQSIARLNHPCFAKGLSNPQQGLGPFVE